MSCAVMIVIGMCLVSGVAILRCLMVTLFDWLILRPLLSGI